MSLTANYTFVGKGNWSIDGVGGSATGGGVLTALVPEGSTIQRAYLYASTFNTGAMPATVTLTLGPASTTLDADDYVALGATSGGSAGLIQAFRADITAFASDVISDGDDDAFEFTAAVSGENTDGFGLVVVYSNPDESIRTVSLLDGVSATTGDDFELSFSEALDTTQPGFEAVMSLGIGFSTGNSQSSRITVDGRELTTAAGGFDDGAPSNGALFTIGGIGDSTTNPDPDSQSAEDDELYDLAQGNVDDSTSFLADGAESIAVRTVNPSNNDNIFFAGFNITAVVAVDTDENDAPVAVNDDVTVGESGTVTFNVLGNDFDPDDGDEFNIISFDDTGLVGTFTEFGAGTFTYDPGDAFDDLNEGEEATTSFTYTISDGEESATGTVTITIEGEDDDGPDLNDPPVAVNDEAEVDEDDTVTFNVLANDSDPDEDDTLSITSVDSSSLLGFLTNNGDGSFTYDPGSEFGDLAEGESATTSFTYTVSDGEESSTATVTITINGEDGDVPPPSDCPTVDREGTQDGSFPADQELTGPEGSNTFYFDNGGDTGDDRVTNLEANDVIVTDLALFDSNNDGLIGFGGNGKLDLSGAGGTVEIDGVMRLRFLGEACEDNWVYGAAYVRPDDAMEGFVLTDDAMMGDMDDMAAEVFFFDTALDLALGDDTIAGFGSGDVLVTTTQLADSNNDGIIGFGSDLMLDLPGGGGTVDITNTAGVALSRLEYDGSVSQDGVTYYVYSTVGSSVGVDALG